ncbi:MAG TPA: CAP domain-containing protein [Puia sp.]|nr:CAP domain-containing protein [Puia sp.]
MLVGLMMAVQLPAKEKTHSFKNKIDDDILYYVNVHRKSKGLRPLKLNSVESSVATRHSRDMATGKIPFGHQGFDDRARDLRKKLGTITLVGENVASGQMTAKEAVDGWLHSPGHKRNIEGDFTLTGIGWAKDKRGMIYYTQIFTK